MAQRIQNSNLQVVDETLPMSSTKRGLGAMTLPNPGMRNEFDGGLRTKMDAPQDPRSYELQNIQQNTISAQPQANVAARGQVTKQMTEGASQESRAIQFKNQEVANMLDNSETKGAGMQTLNRAMEGPNRDKFLSDIKISADMWNQSTPKLAG